jgi:beta-glucosidase
MKTGLPYQDATLPVEQRIADLIQHMTLPEKVGQMLQLDARQDVTGLIRDFHVGSILHTSPADMILAARLARQTRLQIPLLTARRLHPRSFVLA